MNVEESPLTSHPYLCSRQRVNSLGQLLNISNTQKKGMHKFDNKFMETLPKAIIENTANHDEKAKVKLRITQLENELKTVALEWKSSRNMEECGCSTTFDAFNNKVHSRAPVLFRHGDPACSFFPVRSTTTLLFQHHCWSCGCVLCTRCMAVHAKLPGHLSQRAVPTCKSCYQSSAVTSASPWLRSAE